MPPAARALEETERQALLADLEDIVVSSHLFKSLDAEGRARLIGSGYVIGFEAGDTIIRQGDEGAAMYLVLQGRVRVETEGARSAVQLAELGRGACLGEVSVLTGSTRTATVIAMTPVQVVTFERHRIERVIDAYPRVRKLLEAMVEGRARDTVEKIIGS
jgi:CRP-like cAMP-binding protein